MEVFGKWSNSKESTKLSWHEQLLINFIQEYFYIKFVYKNFTRGRIYFENFWPRRSKYLDSRKSCYSYPFETYLSNFIYAKNSPGKA